MTRKGNKNREGEGERAKRQTRGDDGGRLKIRRDYKWRNKERAEQNVRSGEILTKETRAREGAPEIATDDALNRYKEHETAITTKKRTGARLSSRKHQISTEWCNKREIQFT